MQFSLLNGSIHDSWLQQGHEGLHLDKEMQARCEVLVCKEAKSDEVATLPLHALCTSLHVALVGLPYLFAASSSGVYGVITADWCSNFNNRLMSRQDLVNGIHGLQKPCEAHWLKCSPRACTLI